MREGAQEQRLSSTFACHVAQSSTCERPVDARAGPYSGTFERPVAPEQARHGIFERPAAPEQACNSIFERP